jgi:isoleucyl-tRNA synthetase
MYTFAPTNPARRSAQTVLWKITDALVRLLAPVLTFTSDEVWEYLPKVDGHPASVHLAQFPKPKEIFSGNLAKLLEDWKVLFNIRDQVLILLEGARQDKLIGKSLEAELEFLVKGDVLDVMKRHESGLKELLNVSKVDVVDASGKVAFRGPSQKDQIFRTQTSTDLLSFAVYAASGSKCARCWNFMPHVSNYGIWENVCERCRSMLKEMGIDPPQPPE